MKKLKHILRAARFAGIVLILVMIVCFGITAYRVANRMSEDEIRSHTLTQVCEAVGKYMDQNDGRWPNSWDDLAGVQMEPNGFYDWPNEINMIRREIEIDFTASPTTLVNETPETFSAIKPNGKIYTTFLVHSYSPLIEIIRTHHLAIANEDVESSTPNLSSEPLTPTPSP